MKYLTTLVALLSLVAQQFYVSHVCNISHGTKELSEVNVRDVDCGHSLQQNISRIFNKDDLHLKSTESTD